MTHTIGGLRIDDRARVLDGGGAPVPDLYAAGADAGGIFTGGYGSGLAAALVYGRIAAETALAETSPNGRLSGGTTAVRTKPGNSNQGKGFIS